MDNKALFLYLFSLQSHSHTRNALVSPNLSPCCLRVLSAFDGLYA